MSFTPRALGRVFTVFAMVVAGLGLAAAPASADTNVYYDLEPGVFSPIHYGQAKTPGDPLCKFRLRYGNFGNVAFAQVRLYAGGCLDYAAKVRAASGTNDQYFDNNTISGGTDSVGDFFQVQATSPANWIALGGIALSGRPSPNKIFYRFNNPDF